MRATDGIIQALGLAAIGVVGLATAASAQVHDADVGIDQSYNQTSDSTTVLDEAYFSARVFYYNYSDYTPPGTLTIPGGGTYSLINQGYSTPELGYQQTFTGPTGFTDAQAAFQTGTYSYDIPAGAYPEAIFSIDYTGNAFPNTPLVTNLSTLQDLNAAESTTFDLNGMIVSPNATPGDNFIYFYIYNASTNALVYDDIALGPTTGDIVVPGGTLAADTSYYFNLVYDDRIVGASGNITLTQFYDIGTTGDFATAAGVVPEPSTWAMMLIGFAGLGLAGYRMRRAAISA